MNKMTQRFRDELLGRFDDAETPNEEAELWVAALDAVAERIGDWTSERVDEGKDTVELDAIGEQLQDLTDLVKETCLTGEGK